MTLRSMTSAKIYSAFYSAYNARQLYRVKYVWCLRGKVVSMSSVDKTNPNPEFLTLMNLNDA